MRIVFLDSSTVTRSDVDFGPIEELGEWIVYETTRPHEATERIRGADVVITNKVVLDAKRIAAAVPPLKLIAVAATGTNNVDLDAAKRAGVQVCNVRDYSTGSVAQHTLALILNLRTFVSHYAADPLAWSNSDIFTRLDFPVSELEGQTLGLVGVGHIGSRVGELGEAFGMRVQALARDDSHRATRHPEWPRLETEDFFRTSDVVSLHCPLTPGTRHLIREETLAWMKPSALVINTGRGELVDEAALIGALQDERIGGAGLDVLTTEPPPRDHPLLRLNHPRLLITPHSAWSSREARQRLVCGVASNIATFLREGVAGNRVA